MIDVAEHAKNAEHLEAMGETGAAQVHATLAVAGALQGIGVVLDRIDSDLRDLANTVATSA